MCSPVQGASHLELGDHGHHLAEPPGGRVRRLLVPKDLAQQGVPRRLEQSDDLRRHWVLMPPEDRAIDQQTFHL